MTDFAELARVSQEIAATRSRNEKTRVLAELYLKLDPREVASATGWLSAEPPCGALGLGYASFAELSDVPFAEVATMSIEEVDAALAVLRDTPKTDLVSAARGTFAKLTREERDLMIGSMSNTLRQGGLAGVMMRAIAKASAIDEKEVRRVAMLEGSAARAADAILGSGKGKELPRALTLFTPIAPMLAATAESVSAAFSGLSSARVEWKVDGVRAQVHKKGSRVAIYSRQQNEIESADIRAVVATFSAESLVLDGEIVLLDEAGHARPFQETFSRIASGGALAPGYSLKLFAFDCLHKDGVDLVDDPLSARIVALNASVPELSRMPAIETTDADDAQRFFENAREKGHEGVMVKDLAAPYSLGARGEAWRKVKEVRTVDLVILAVEWGSGRRKGTLSNLHLGARDEKSATGFCMVGKTFKGLTDEMLAFQTKKLLSLETSRDSYVVFVRPELVVEIAFNDVQKSHRYEGGIALRFARVLRYREDKRASEADTIESLQALLPKPAPEPTAPKKKQLSLFGDD